MATAKKKPVAKKATTKKPSAKQTKPLKKPVTKKATNAKAKPQTTQTHSTWKHFNFLAIFAIFGIIIGFTACHKETKFEGTWTREDNRYQLIFNKNNFLLNVNYGKPNSKGTFTFTENELQLVITHVFINDNWFKLASLLTVEYTFIDDNTFVLNQGKTNVGNVFTDSWNKLSE